MASNNLESLRRGNDAKPFQSKLASHLSFIENSRAANWSYTRIAAELSSRFGLRVAPSTIHSFVKARAKKRGVYEIAQAPTSMATARPASDPIEALKNRKPLRVPTGVGWISYDPSKPLEKLS